VQKAQPQPVAEQQQGLEEAPEQQQQQQQEEGKLTGAAKESYKLIHGNGGLTSWLVCAAVNRDSAQVHGAPTHLPELLLDETISLPLSPADLQKLAESHPAHMCLWGDPHLPEVGAEVHRMHEAVHLGLLDAARPWELNSLLLQAVGACGANMSAGIPHQQHVMCKSLNSTLT
jgi:hypothetical protein